MHVLCYYVCMTLLQINRINDKKRILNVYSAQSSLCIFAQKYLRQCKDANFISQNKYLCIYEDSLGAKILGDDCALSFSLFVLIGTFLPNYLCTFIVDSIDQGIHKEKM